MKKVTVVGGDSRLITVKNRLERGGFLVDTIGLFENDNGDISSSQIVVLPVPTTRDGVNVFTPLTGKIIPLSIVEKSLREDALVLCCNYSPKDADFIDYNRLDSYALLNAVPTAEGAIMLVIQNTAFTLFGSRCLIIGFGRVGKILADRLKGFGCDITVSARKSSDFAHINALNMTCTHTRLLNENPLDYDIIFNTVDFPVLNENSLKNSKCKCIIDLSSKGGFNLEYAKSLNITAIKAPSLPALTAPETAGEFLAQTILDSINSQE